ncbi:FAD-dependent monooxygenase [Scleromatobacter humisilvae]|uniref:FAD-dependent monooxygenase n=1 Tax=Scleromatobacter humisilvae TaxID=2897159 RepID=A0A9X1YNC9_9BURK|nr:FAD-dependent monooxygenase [Scleromatobacter humisilvae]MCK9688150.1 FAD-dependent monooxygenase [Scleromatobacter humisilvae]
MEHAVVIAGAGPTGLMLAGELALAGVDVAVVERRVDQQLAGTRARGLHARSIELLDQRGLAERFIAQGRMAPRAQFGGMPLHIGDLPTRHACVLALEQQHVERLLADWIAGLGVPVLRGREVTGFAQDDDGVDIHLAAGGPLRARYLVGCDGGRSRVRKAAGIEFPGWDATTSSLIAEAAMAGEPPWGIRRDAIGLHAISRIEGSGRVQVMVAEQCADATGEPTLRELADALVAAYGTDFGIHAPSSISRFGDTTRQAATYRDRRVLLAGDAAHVHAPDGGQGLDLGLQDAVNLGWKLAQVVLGTSPESLLDTYHAERHPAGARMLRKTMALVALRRPDDRSAALREAFAELLANDDARRGFAASMCGLDIRHDLGDGHPLLGRRMPDRDLVTADGPTRVFQLLHAARPVLLNFGPPGSLPIAGQSDRVRRVDATSAGPWELPSIGTVDAPGGVLIRPDGHAAWVGGADLRGLDDALATWCGAR